MTHPGDPVLTVTALNVQYGGALTVRDVDLTLRVGETVALVGGSGAGKSTVAKAVAGLVAPSAGRIRLDLPTQARSPGRNGASSRAGAPNRAGAPSRAGAPGWTGETVDLLAAPAAVRRAARRHVHLVMQDPYASLPPHRRLLDIVAEPLVIHRIGSALERRAEARRALTAVGLDPERYALRLPHELSGGERQRAAFARAVVTRPAVILADEPTGMLDASLRAEVSDLMSDLAREHGTAILHITHDLALAARTCDRVIVMADGGIVEQGPTAQLLRDPQHEMTARLLGAARRGAGRGARRRGERQRAAAA